MRRFAVKQAASAGFPTADHYLESLTPRQLDEAIATATFEPTGEDRADKRMAWLAACVVYPHLGEDPPELADFATSIEAEFKMWLSGDKPQPIPPAFVGQFLPEPINGDNR